MKTSNPILFMLFSLCTLIATNASNDHERKPYIVYMGELPEETVSLSDAHNNILSEAIGDETIARNSKIHSYGKSFNGFAARLLPKEVRRLSQKEGVVSVFPSEKIKLRTTRSWDFIGFPQEVSRDLKTESNIIVGLLDSGVYVDSPSFNDKGVGPPPKEWKGTCANGLNFNGCNNKVIGARYFNINNSTEPGEQTPQDTQGHGTHTASTIAGVIVEGANLYGMAEGAARGAVTSARIASYKVCWRVGCDFVDILAAFDQAIADGVDVISVSLGGGVRPLFKDTIAIGSFHAMKKGIITICSAGNEGPSPESVENVAPWIFTVAASTIDRRFETDIKLGNGEMISGISALNTFSLQKSMYPLTDGVRAQLSGVIDGNSSACDYYTLNQTKVTGKIAYCQGGGSDVIDGLGGIGTIMSTAEDDSVAVATLVPSTYVTIQDGLKIDAYINSSNSPQAVIYKTRTVNSTDTAPVVPWFSSRGPQFLSQLIKPDVTAPGVNILAGWTKFGSMTGDPSDIRIVKYNVVSGTSMSCPHVSGATAYVKSFHPSWSPAALRSALMTTARPMKVRPDMGALASGSGEISPTKAVNPGLVYDMEADSYISFFCREGYESSSIALITGDKVKNCSDYPIAQGVDGLNYPSIHLQLKNYKDKISAVFVRIVTNVGDGKSVYKANVKAEKGLSITVTPNTLTFDSPNQRKSFEVVLTGKYLDEDSQYLFGSLVWSDSKHIVKSPVVVYRPSPF